jgi:VIT1/CCC1 family predicted Fe2+/Mn2+ transporter
MEHDAVGAHARDELGIFETTTARPVQAAFVSAATFTVGAALPLVSAFVSPERLLVMIVPIASLGFLAVLGGVSAQAGGAPVAKAMARVTLWGALAMAVTAGIGAMFGVAA